MVKQMLTLGNQMAQRLEVLEKRLAAVEQQFKNVQLSTKQIVSSTEQPNQAKAPLSAKAARRRLSAVFDNA